MCIMTACLFLKWDEVEVEDYYRFLKSKWEKKYDMCHNNLSIKYNCVEYEYLFMFQDHAMKKLSGNVVLVNVSLVGKDAAETLNVQMVQMKRDVVSCLAKFQTRCCYDSRCPNSLGHFLWPRMSKTIMHNVKFKTY